MSRAGTPSKFGLSCKANKLGAPVCELPMKHQQEKSPLVMPAQVQVNTIGGKVSRERGSIYKKPRNQSGQLNTYLI